MAPECVTFTGLSSGAHPSKLSDAVLNEKCELQVQNGYENFWSYNLMCKYSFKNNSTIV